MRVWYAKEKSTIQIGRASENDALTVRFDVRDWTELYGAGGSFVLVHQRPGDAQPYVCAASVAANGYLDWVVTAIDVEKLGSGEAQVTYTIDGTVAKSAIFRTQISRSLGQSGELPEPYESKIDELIEAAGNITTEANRAETARTGAETAQAAAEAAKTSAEAYAVGERNGNPVEEGDPAYHNNAKYWAELAESAEGANKIFWVTPDVTTSQEIDAAIAADKYPVLRTVGLSPQRYLLFSGKSSYSQSFIPGQFINYIDYDFEYLSPTGSSVTQKLTVNVNSGYENWGSHSINSYLATKVSVNTLRSRIAPDYSANATYEVDDYVFQSEYLYKCKEAILTPEAWNSAHWESVVLTTEVFDKINDVIASIDEKADTVELAELEAAFDGEIFMAPSIETEKVDGGTMIKNQLWLNKCAAIVGAAYSLEEEKLYFYGVLGYKVFPKSRKTLYRLMNKDSEEAPYELTPENAPTKSEFSTSNSYGVYKFRLRLSTFVHHVDIRLCCIYYDTSGNEIERVYSSQYRYVVDKTTGAVTRTKFNTANTDPTHVVDIGLYASDESMNTTYNYVDSKNYALLPLVSSVQEIQYRFIVPDSYFNNAPYGLSVVAIMGDKTRYVSGSFFKAEDKVAELEEKVSEIISEQEARFVGEMVVGTPALTERVEGGTLLKNQLWLNKCVSVVGYAFEEETSKLWVYEVFGSNTPDGGSQKSYRLLSKDVATEEELTVENAPISSEITNCPAFAKYRTSISNVQDHADYRLCRIRYDENGNEVERIYSAQYRYTISNGVVTRTRFNTSQTSATHIIDIGLVVNESVASTTFNTILTASRTVLPLVSTVQDIQWKFIIPDSMFENAPYGLSVIAVDGEYNNKYISAAFFKAEDKIAELEEKVFDAFDKQGKIINAESTVGAPILTERVDGGTWIKNQLWLDNCVAQIGYYRSGFKLCIYALFGSEYKNTPPSEMYTNYVFYVKNNDEERELTYEYASSISAKYNIPDIQNDILTCEIPFDSSTQNIDVCFCQIVYRNGEIVKKIYSAQYRYSIFWSNNSVIDISRRSFTGTDTRLIGSTNVIDIGIIEARNKNVIINSDDASYGNIIPLIMEYQEPPYKFVVSDAFFDGLTNSGYLCILVKTYGKPYCSGAFKKAEPNGKSVFTFTATPDYDQGGQITSYIFDCEISEINKAVSLGKTIQCFIFYRNQYIPTFVNLELISSAETYIYVTPIIKSVNDVSLANFRIANNYIIVEPTIPKSILINTYGIGGNKRVPMTSADDEISFYTINDFIDIGNVMETLVAGAHSMAAQAGTATLATIITDVNMLSILKSLFNLYSNNVENGRGMFTKMAIGTSQVILNFNSYMAGDESITAIASFAINDYGTDGQGVIQTSTVYSGTFTITMTVDNTSSNPISASVTIHLDKHEAIIV